MDNELKRVIRENVRAALEEDIGSGDLTATLISERSLASARIVAREQMVLAGQPWAQEVFRQVDPHVSLHWLEQDGDRVEVDTVICELKGPARALVTGERTALNFLQMLSGTATVTSRYVRAVAHTGARILDTRKTIPGLRLAQKYAVRCGGGTNHRTGLYDAILVKENHIASAGGIDAAVAAARQAGAGVPIEVEVESLQQLGAVLAAGIESVLLDNFSVQQMKEAVELNRRQGRPPAKLEASGGLTMDDLRTVAETGIDYISIGALTKNVQAIDLSMRFA